MDTTKTLTHASLCFGYGGIDIGLKRAIGDVRTVLVSEIESFACANVVKLMETGLMEPAPVWTNLKTLPWELFRGKVDILSGGFPCQPFSSAGRRAGDEDPRHLFPYILDGITRLGHPGFVFLENVEGILSSKLTGDDWRDPAGTPVLLHVLRELERVGYRAEAAVVSASEVGAPHRRKRLFILGVRQDLADSPDFRSEWSSIARQRCTQGPVAGCGDGIWDMADSNNRGGRQDLQPTELRTAGVEQPSSNSWFASQGQGSQVSFRSCHDHSWVNGTHAWPSRPGQRQYSWEPPRVVGNTKHDGLIAPAVTGGAQEVHHGDASGENQSLQSQGTSGSRDHGSIQAVEYSEGIRIGGEHRDLEGTDEQTSRGILNATSSTSAELSDSKGRGLQEYSECSEQCGEGGERESNFRGVHSCLGEGRMVDAAGERLEGGSREGCGSSDSNSREDGCQRQVVGQVGGDLDGPTNRMGQPSLYESHCDRGSELRMLGNGVVPQSCERAFRILIGRICQD